MAEGYEIVSHEMAAIDSSQIVAIWRKFAHIISSNLKVLSRYCWEVVFHILNIYIIYFKAFTRQK